MSYHATGETPPQAAQPRADLGWLYALTVVGAGVLAVVLTSGSQRKNPNRGKWIKSAIKHPGALRSWVRRKYGDDGFDSKGRIKASVLRRHKDAPGTLGKRVRLALNLRIM